MLRAFSPRSSWHLVGVQVREHRSASSMKGRKELSSDEEQQKSTMRYKQQARGGAVCSGHLAREAHGTMLACKFGRTNLHLP